MRLSSTLHEGTTAAAAMAPDVLTPAALAPAALAPAVRRPDDAARAQRHQQRRAAAAPFTELLELLEWHDEANTEAASEAPANATASGSLPAFASSRRTRAALERTHLEAVAGRVNSRLPAAVLAELEALPDDSYLTMIRSPELFHAAFWGAPERLAAAVQTWIAVERARPGAATPLDGTVRAAGCDRLVTARAGFITAIDELPRIDTGGPETGPALDTTSELPGRLVTRFPDRILVSPSAEDTAATLDKLARAWILLREVAPCAQILVGDMTQIICARTAQDDQRFYTASDASTLGVVHLFNAHLPRKNAAEVASELVHEAIHQTLFRWEFRHRLLADPKAASAKLRSPWTGATLDLYAFLHACFVWYGVANLWRLPSAPADLAVTRQRRAAESGFAHHPLDLLRPHRHALSPSIWAAIEQMTDNVAPI